MTDPLGRKNVNLLDPQGRLSSKILIENGRPFSRYDWSYDAAGNCIKEHTTVMEEGQRIRDYWVDRSYNSRGLLGRETEMPIGKTFWFEYDTMKRLETKIKPDDVAIHYTYDALGRKKSLKSSDGTVSYIFDYDLHDNVIEIKDMVHNITQKRTFDFLNRIESEEFSPGVFVRYNYNKNDHVERMTLPDGTYVLYNFAPRLNVMGHYCKPGEPKYVIECPEYNLRGSLLKVRTPAGTTSFTHDLLGRTIKVEAPSWKSILKEFDKAGNLIQSGQEDPTGSIQGVFFYDRFNHLTDEYQHQTNKYSYDSLGNCLSKNGSCFHINEGNQVEESDKAVCTYDLNGNLKTESSPKATYTYDALNRLISCKKEGQETTFIYDAFGRCLQIKDTSGTKHLFYQGSQEIGSVVDGKVVEFRLVHPDEKYEKTFAIEIKDHPYFPVQDERGNICLLHDDKGNAVQWTRYSAFGSQTLYGDIKGVVNPWRFANRREVASLSLFSHRFYNPRLMRWQTADPLGFEDDLNLYSYVRNNPFSYCDPDGRFAFVLVFPLMEVAFGAAIEAVVLPCLTKAAITAAVFLGAYQASQYIGGKINDNQMHAENQELDEEEKKKRDGKRPPYCGQELGDDASKCPGEGFRWEGKGGPESGKGSWVKGSRENGTLESIHSDFNHPPPKKPHWDYEGFGEKARLNLDGTWEWK